jgi:hypothetical protein
MKTCLIIEEFYLLGYGAMSSIESQPTFLEVVPPKRWMTFNGLHGVISQKIELFITTAVRTSNLTLTSSSSGVSFEGI